MAARKWTPEQKAKQSALIKTWKPWQNSTGPTTEEGKAKTAQNACKGRVRRLARLMQWLIKNQGKVSFSEYSEKLKALMSLCLAKVSKDDQP